MNLSLLWTTVLATSLFLVSLNAQEEKKQIIAKEGSAKDVDLCFLKQIHLEGYLITNVIGKCPGGDPAMNGREYYIVLQPENPDLGPQKIVIAEAPNDIYNIKKVRAKGNKLSLITITDEMNDADPSDEGWKPYKQVKRKITYESVDPDKGTFDVTEKLIK